VCFSRHKIYNFVLLKEYLESINDNVDEFDKTSFFVYQLLSSQIEITDFWDTKIFLEIKGLCKQKHLRTTDLDQCILCLTLHLVALKYVHNVYFTILYFVEVPIY
jgi:hypothetical protein